MSDDYGNMGYCNPTTNQRVSLTTYVRSCESVTEEDYKRYLELALIYFRNIDGVKLIDGIYGFIELLRRYNLDTVAEAVIKWKYGMINSSVRPFGAPIFSRTSDRRLMG